MMLEQLRQHGAPYFPDLLAVAVEVRAASAHLLLQPSEPPASRGRKLILEAPPSAQGGKFPAAVSTRESKERIVPADRLVTRSILLVVIADPDITDPAHILVQDALGVRGINAGRQAHQPH